MKTSRAAAMQARAMKEMAERLERIERKVDFIVGTIKEAYDERALDEVGDPFVDVDEAPTEEVEAEAEEAEASPEASGAETEAEAPEAKAEG